jgi:hypothetical protein
MSVTTEIEDSVYSKLLVQSLPKPIRTEAEHERLTALLLKLDEMEAIHRQGAC